MSASITKKTRSQGWEIVSDAFSKWLSENEDKLGLSLNSEPTIKVLIFMALIDANKACSYAEIRDIFKKRHIINGVIPDNTLRTSIFNLGKTLDKYNHAFELQSSRGKFKLIPRTTSVTSESLKIEQDPVIFVLDPPAIKAKDIATELIEKARLPFHSLYFLEWSARWWQIFSHNESEIRVQYEAGAWEKLEVKTRLFANPNNIISFVSLAPGEGLAEIELLKKILSDDSNKKVHYMAIDSSQRLLREHINLLRETLATDINNGRILCTGVIADIFNNLRETLSQVRKELVNKRLISNEEDFIPPISGLLATYFGNCLGNYYQDQETEIFSIIYSTFLNRPMEFLVGVSVMRSSPDEYKRNWDDFLLQTPKNLLEINKLLESGKPHDDTSLPEFKLPKEGDNERCPSVIPESYIVRHGIRGQIYRFYYKLSYDLKLASNTDTNSRYLPKGSLILLYNIVKYDIPSLVSGIKICGLFKVKYKQNYTQMVDTPNGIREYAVFSAYLN